MALTPQMIDAMNKATGNNVPLDSKAGSPPVQSRADQIRALGKQSQPTQPESAPSPFMQDINRAGGDVYRAIKGEGEYAGQNPIQRGVEAAGNAARGVSTSVMNAVANKVPFGKEALGTAGELYKNTIDAAGEVTGGIGRALGRTKFMQDLVAKNPELADNITSGITNLAKTGVSLGDIANLILGAKGVVEGTQRAVNTVKDVASGVRTINEVASTRPLQAAQNHLDSAKMVLDNEPNVTPAEAIQHAHTNIVDGLKAEQGTDMQNASAAVSKLNPKDYTSLDEYSNAVEDAISKGSAEQGGGTFNTREITDLYNRAIRPSVSGKGNATQIASANSRVIDGLKSIVDNKDSLTFTNADGETITGSTPKSVDQLSQAVGQTKKAIFEKYDALAKQAGEKGITVDPQAVTGELDSVVNNKAVQLANPQAVDYAKSVQERFNNVGEMTPAELQDTIEVFNNKLKSYYRNPTPQGFSDAAVDSMMVNKLRQMLDDAISSNTEGAYQDLRNQYGALASMEKDVAHRSVVWARQNKVGLAGNIANIASGAELARGLLTMNPADIAVSLGIKAIEKYSQYLNNPDIGVSRLFSAIEKSSPPSTGNMTLPSEPSTVGDSSGTSIPQEVPKEQGGIPKMQTGQAKITDGNQFIRAKNLSPEDRVTETKAFNHILKNEDSILSQYKEKYGKVVNADNFRPFLKGIGYNGSNSAAVQEAVSYLAKRARTEELKNAGDYAVGTAGGSGAGKTAAGNGLPEIKGLTDNAAMVLDSNFSSLDSAHKFIDEVHKAGKKFIGVYTYREAMDALTQGIVKRALTNLDEMGRIVPNSVSAGNHIDSFNVVQQLVKEGAHFKFVDNSLGNGKARLVTLDELKKKVKYPSKEELKKTFDDKIKEIYQNKTPFTDKDGNQHVLTREQYNKFIE